jgi:hypothetical protein
VLWWCCGCGFASGVGAAVLVIRFLCWGIDDVVNVLWTKPNVRPERARRRRNNERSGANQQRSHSSHTAPCNYHQADTTSIARLASTSRTPIVNLYLPYT